MKNYLQILLLFVVPFSLFAQEYGVRGKVQDTLNKPLSFVNILVLKSSDSSFVKGSSTDDFGAFQINGLSEGQYIVKFSYIGYSELSIPLILNEDKNLKTVVLEEDVTSLDEVTLVYKKPTVKKEADRLVFGVANTSLVEGDMLQVLRSTPGVLVQDSGISVRGSRPTIFINDRRVQLSGDEITQLLQSSSANSVQSIEVITNPSAKYDADSGMVINIVMGKNLVTGYNGSINTAYTQGVYPRYDVGTNHFFKNDKLNVNLSYNFSKDKLAGTGDDIINYLDSSNNVDEIWRSATDRVTKSNTHNASVNFDYFINDNNTLSLSSTALYLPFFDYSIDNKTKITDASGAPLSNFNSINNSQDDKYNVGIDLNFKHDFTKGAISFNGHYTTYNYQRDQAIRSRYFDNDQNQTDLNSFSTDANQDTNIFTSKIDYSLPITDASNFEAGIKYSDIQTNSDIQQYDVDPNTGEETIDLANTDAFDYDEKVYAAYVNYALNTDKWALNLGVRAEQTNVEGVSISTDQINTQDYFELFPNSSLQYQFSEGYSIIAKYKRSITRPAYPNLNPFKVYINENLISTGNPNLRPTFTNQYSIETNLFGNFAFEFYYQNRTNDIFEIPIQDNDTNITNYTSVNFDDTEEYGLILFTYFGVTDWWFLTATGWFYNVSETSNFGLGKVNQSQWSSYGDISNEFTFLKDQSLNASLTLTYLGAYQVGFRQVEDRLFSDVSISKSIWNKKAVISLSASDLFNLQDQRTSVRYSNQFSSLYRDIDNRYIKVGFRYNFGNTKLESNKRGISKDERDRLEKKE